MLTKFMKTILTTAGATRAAISVMFIFVFNKHLLTAITQNNSQKRSRNTTVKPQKLQTRFL